MWNRISMHFNTITAEMNSASFYNKRLIEPSVRPAVRDIIYSEIDSLSVEKYIRKYLNPFCRGKHIVIFDWCKTAIKNCLVKLRILKDR